MVRNFCQFTTEFTLNKRLLITDIFLRSDCQFSPPAVTHSIVKLLQESGVRSRKQLSPEKFEFSHNLFVG